MAKQYKVINRRDGRVVGQAKSRQAARRIVDRKDNEYGAYVHVVQVVDNKQEVL